MTPYEVGRKDRALCPVCGYSVRVAGDRLLLHPERATPRPWPAGTTPRPCKGTGAKVEP